MELSAQHATGHWHPFVDASNDPTGTATLRRKFMRASDKRWRAACRLVMEAVGNGDLLGLGQPNLNAIALRARHGGMAGADPVTGFRHWLDNLLRDVVVGHDGSWLAPFVSSAEELAAKRARDIGVSVPPPSMSMTMPHRALVLSELHALATLGVQRGTRAAASALASRQRPQAAARRIVAALREAMLRSRLMTDYAVSKAFTGTMINHFRAAGITKVGIVPERRRRVGVRDKDVALEADTEEDVVGFCTQEDDLVCQECQDLAQETYTLDEINDLLPVHANCRCFPCPADDVEFVSPAAKELLGLGAMSRAEAGALGLGAVAGALGAEAPELPAGVASAAGLGEPEEGEEEGLGAGGVVAAALGLGAAAAGAAGLLGGKRQREEPEEEPGEVPMPEIKEPIDYPEDFAGHTAAEYTAYVNRWLDWALENGWTEDMIGERWDDEEALRDKVGMTPEQEEALLQRVDEVASLVEK